MTAVPRLSLRRRVALALGAGSLLITSALSFATWTLATDYLLRQREQAGARQAEVNARLVDQSLRQGAQGLEELLTGLTTGPDSTVLLFRPGGVLTSGRQVDPGVLPRSLVALGREGTAAKQRLRVEGVPVLAVTLPITAAEGAYVELVPLVQLDRTFRFLSAVMVLGVLVSGLLGVGLGVWTGRRALRPLTEFTRAASRVAGGDLSARLPPQTDPDLTHLATTFNATAEALERRVLRDARFAGDVSHELRSPLTTMVNAVQVLRRRRADLPGAAGKALDLLTGEVDRFARMVVDLLEISRADQRADGSEAEPIDLAELVRNVLAARPGSTTPLEAEPAWVLGDRRRLDRVVSNLLDNADRHAGGAIRVGVLRRDGRVRLEVDDAGPGVPPELRERVFQRFDRGARAGSRGADTGSGLGLALVAQHVQRHGGTTGVEPRPGGGARFFVELPETPR
ncbi:signal transduction histidine kinase [Saccharothrix coeruleofusca]|uniref:sensor histidine kinase n=1 Tax=Saccharothrix coeruleofusca TaxID=33919 RepID=UPI0016717548|nr:HAMP domain-containing sensor histidine kinase [Saccharothrix coeruleofusca]MBP2336745.1 signal transduction histidine kinase [Saccharothrix coeruleofusca]